MEKHVSDVVSMDMCTMSFLDEAYDLISTGQVVTGLEHLFSSLHMLRLVHPVTEWKELVTGYILRHPITRVIHSEPFTRRAFEKPRGYAGDAVMIDYIYGLANVKLAAPITHVHEFVTTRGAAGAVNNRCRIISKMIDDAAATTKNLSVLSVACGHLREAHYSEAIRNSHVGSVVAFDVDEESLDKVRADYSTLPITTVKGNVRDLIVGRSPSLGSFDFIYASGLYDYLEDTVACRLSNVLFSMLNDNGTLVIPNFVPGIRDLGYMESFMDWHLIYRNRSDMLRLVHTIRKDKIKKLTTFFEKTGNIVFLTVTKNATTSGTESGIE